jgi:hypothetical protein
MGEFLLAPLKMMSILIALPWLAAVIGVLFAGFGWRTGRRSAVIAGIAWLIYSVYETGMQQRWLCTGECNIRVDLLLIYPVLILLSIGPAVSLFRGPRR